MAQKHRHPRQRSNACDSQEWRDSQVLFLLTCYDIWSATPCRHCAEVLAADGTA